MFEETRASITNLWDQWETMNHTLFLTEKCVQKREQLETLIMEYHRLRQRVETEDLELRNSTFRCEALDRCIIQCNPPSEAILRKSVIMTFLPFSRAFETGCTTEWFIHGNLASGLVAVCIWILLNLSRLLLVDSYKSDRRASSGNVDVKYFLFIAWSVVSFFQLPVVEKSSSPARKISRKQSRTNSGKSSDNTN